MKLTPLMIANGYVYDELNKELTRINGDSSHTIITHDICEWGDVFYISRDKMDEEGAEWIATRYYLTQACELGLQWDDPSTLVYQDNGCVIGE